MKKYLLSTLLLFIFPMFSSCAPQPYLAEGASLRLANFSENGVMVSIFLERGNQGSVFLAATFTPLETGYHLYSKDIPRDGVDGIGRPTLLELTADSKMQAIGELEESIAAQPQDGWPEALRIYPAGSVTMRLPVALPAGESGWVDDYVSVTFMICSEGKCKAPVIDKIVSVRVPGGNASPNP